MIKDRKTRLFAALALEGADVQASLFLFASIATLFFVLTVEPFGFSYYRWWERGNVVNRISGIALFLMLWYRAIRYFAAGAVVNYEKDLRGKVVVVTGANIGIGLTAATELCRMGATVVLACRNQKKADEAKLQIIASLQERRSFQGTTSRNAKPIIEYLPLDLSDLESVRAFALQFNQKYDRLDILVNNAGALLFDM